MVIFEYTFGSMSTIKNCDGETFISCPKDAFSGRENSTSVGLVNFEEMRLQQIIYESTGEIMGVIEETVWTDVAEMVDG